MAEPFTLKVFVPSGDPESTRIIEKMNWTGRGYFVPRADWPNVKYRQELASAGIYILLGHEQDELGNELTVAYIGQAENIRTRLDQHEATKDFWENAMFFVSTNGGLNRAHITWLEWELMKQAATAGRCKLQNGLTHTEPTLSESEKADVRAFLNEMLRLIPVMGIHIFEPAKSVAVNAVTISYPSAAMPDVIVVPAQKEGFESAFLGANAWWAIRIAAKHRPNLKWIAVYQVAPIQAVTHIAKIERFEPYGDDGKFKVVFQGPAAKLEKPIPYANAPSGAMQGARYCTKAAFDSAQSVKDFIH